MANTLMKLGDSYVPHFFAPIVMDNSTEEFLKALDDAHRASFSSGSGQGNSNGPEQRTASWFKGQLINLNIDGSINTLPIDKHG